MKRNKQMMQGHIPNKSKRASRAKKNLRPIVSAHTKRFRALFAPLRFEDGSLGAGQEYVGDSPPIPVKSMRSVGG